MKDKRNTDEGRKKRIDGDRRYLDRNRDEINNRRRKIYAHNADIKREQRRIWAKSNPDAVQAANVKVRMRRLRRAPPWLTTEDWDAMDRIYRDCRVVSTETGIDHQVDHIVPLLGKQVSGLHVPWNLQILTASENSKKKNYFDV